MTLPASIGRYTVLGELGRGAMGVVLRALDPALDRAVAVKVIAAAPGIATGSNAELEARFLREARVAARISHPNVVTVYDAGREGSSLYLVMELVEGESLGARLARGEFPSAPEALEWAAQVADALGAAHALGVIHRDVKPGNIMVAKSGRMKVADFGVAKAVGEETGLTRTGTVVGSPAYMAPEQVRGAALDGRADLFSLGVVVYELLMHRKPFPADTVTTLIYQILHEDPLANPAVCSALGADAAAFLRRCLEKSPAKRIPDAASFAQAARTLAVKAASPDPVTTAPTAAVATGKAKTARAPRLWPAAAALALAAAAVVAVIVARRAPADRTSGVATSAGPVAAAATPAPTAVAPAGAAARPTPPPRASQPARPTKAPATPVAVAAAATEPARMLEPVRTIGAERTPAAPVQAAAPPVVALFYCRRGVEFKVTPEQASVAVDGTAIGRADNEDHARPEQKYAFTGPGRHLVRFSAPGFRTTWIAVVVDPRAADEFVEIDTLLPPQ